MNGYGDLEWLERRVSKTLPTAKDFVIRNSTADNMDKCQAREAIPLELGWPPLPPSEAMFFGSVQHYVLWHLFDTIDDDDWLSWLEDRNFYRAVAHKLAAEDDCTLDVIVRPHLQEQFIAELMISTNLWVEQVWIPWASDLNVLSSEERLYLPLGRVNNTPVWLRGSPDAFTPTLLIDWKTSGSGWKATRAEVALQDDNYAALIQYNYGLTLTEGMFVVYDRDARRWMFHETTITPESVEAALLRDFTHARSLIHNEYTFTPLGEFSKRAWWCSEKFCDAWDVCPAKHLGDGVA